MEVELFYFVVGVMSNTGTGNMIRIDGKMSTDCYLKTERKNLQGLEALCQEEGASLPSEQIKGLIHNYCKT